MEGVTRLSTLLLYLQCLPFAGFLRENLLAASKLSPYIGYIFSSFLAGCMLLQFNSNWLQFVQNNFEGSILYMMRDVTGSN